MKSFLTSRFFILLGAWQLVGIISIIFPTLLFFYILCIPVFILLLTRDHQSLIQADSFSVSISLSPPPELSKKTFLTIQVTPEKPEINKLSGIEVFAPPLSNLKFSQKKVGLTRSNNLFSCRLEAIAVSLGYNELNKIYFNIHSQSGFWCRKLEVPCNKLSFRITPLLTPIPEQSFSEMLSNQRLLYQGLRIMSKGRVAEQFYSVRKYQYPDSLRHIDQKKSAKFNQLMTRIFDSFHNHHLILVLDLGRGMCGELSGSKKHNYYLSACLALAEHALKSRDTVSFLGFSNKIHLRISKTRSLAPFLPILRGDTVLKPREEDSNYELLNSTLAQLASQRSIVVLLSDISTPSVQESLLESLAPICHKHLTVVLGLVNKLYDLNSQILDFKPAEISQTDFTHIFYTYWLNQRLKVFSNSMSSLGGAAISINEDHWINAAVRVYGMLRTSLNS